MFKAFNYSPSARFYNNNLNRYFEKGNELYNNHEKEVKNCLSKYISEEGTINGSELRQNWFSVKETNIFISHSHKDINKVKAFAGWLYESYNLTSFIDSCAWGYCDDLLNKIDKRYCYNPKSNTYDYNKRNYTTSHVHMMLSTALTEMIDQSECVIFFNTPNSIILKDELNIIINNKKKSETTSPWILYELTMISKMRRKKPHRTTTLEHFERRKQEELIVKYDVSEQIEELLILKDEHLNELINIHQNSRNPLDELYNIIECDNSLI